MNLFKKRKHKKNNLKVSLKKELFSYIEDEFQTGRIILINTTTTNNEQITNDIQDILSEFKLLYDYDFEMINKQTLFNSMLTNPDNLDKSETDESFLFIDDAEDLISANDSQFVHRLMKSLSKSNYITILNSSLTSNHFSRKYDNLFLIRQYVSKEFTTF